MFPVYLPSVRYGPGAAKVPEVQYKFTLYSIDSVRTDLQHIDAAFSKLFTAVSMFPFWLERALYLYTLQYFPTE